MRRWIVIKDDDCENKERNWGLSLKVGDYDYREGKKKKKGT